MCHFSLQGNKWNKSQLSEASGNNKKVPKYRLNTVTFHQKYMYIICSNLFVFFQNDLSDEDVHLLARILSVGLVDADPNYLHHLKMYRDLHGR